MKGFTNNCLNKECNNNEEDYNADSNNRTLRSAYSDLNKRNDLESTTKKLIVISFTIHSKQIDETSVIQIIKVFFDGLKQYKADGLKVERTDYSVHIINDESVIKPEVNISYSIKVVRECDDGKRFQLPYEKKLQQFSSNYKSNKLKRDLIQSYIKALSDSFNTFISNYADMFDKEWEIKSIKGYDIIDNSSKLYYLSSIKFLPIKLVVYIDKKRIDPRLLKNDDSINYETSKDKEKEMIKKLSLDLLETLKSIKVYNAFILINFENYFEVIEKENNYGLVYSLYLEFNNKARMVDLKELSLTDSGYGKESFIINYYNISRIIIINEIYNYFGTHEIAWIVNHIQTIDDFDILQDLYINDERNLEKSIESNLESFNHIFRY